MQYYRRRDGVWWARALAVFLALMASSALGAWILTSPRGKIVASPGPVARVHESLYQNCEECHEPFHPVREGTAAQWVAPLFQDANHPWSANSMNQKCDACHEGRVHHTNMKDVPFAGKGNCAECHSDHQGRGFALAFCADHVCNECHDNLNDHFQPTPAQPASQYANQVTRFAAGGTGEHPPFKVNDRSDPGRLRFSHAQHMTVGIPKLKEGEVIDPRSTTIKGTFALAQVAEAEQARYATAADSQLVQLRCGDCHQPDSLRPGGPLSAEQPVGATPDFGGRFMLPINYDNNCRACHPLNVPAAPPQTAKWPGTLTTVTPIPHGQQPAELVTFIRNAVSGQLVRDDPTASEDLVPWRRDKAAHERAEAFVDQAASEVWRILFTKGAFCLECHQVYDAANHQHDGDWIPLPDDKLQARAGDPAQLAQLKIVPPGIPPIWMRSARFSHHAHRTVDPAGVAPGEIPSGISDRNCYTCHSQAWTTNDASAVMLPDINHCRACHTEVIKQIPLPDGKTHPVGGAASNCTECHRYHGGYEPHGGQRGAAAQTPVTLNQTLDDSTLHALFAAP